MFGLYKIIVEDKDRIKSKEFFEYGYDEYDAISFIIQKHHLSTDVKIQVEKVKNPSTLLSTVQRKK